MIINYIVVRFKPYKCLYLFRTLVPAFAPLSIKYKRKNIAYSCSAIEVDVRRGRFTLWETLPSKLFIIYLCYI